MLAIGRKAVSGKVLTLVAELVMAIVALLLLWAFLTGSVPLISQAIENMITGFKRMLCNVGILTSVCKVVIGA